MLLLDVLVQVLEKNNVDISDELAQSIASEVEVKLEEDDRYSIWSTEAEVLFTEALENLKTYKNLVEEGSIPKIELKNLIYKIEELLIKNK